MAATIAWNSAIEAFAVVIVFSIDVAITATDLLEIIENFSLCCSLALQLSSFSPPILLMLDRVANSRKSLSECND